MMVKRDYTVSRGAVQNGRVGLVLEGAAVPLDEERRSWNCAALLPASPDPRESKQGRNLFATSPFSRQWHS